MAGHNKWSSIKHKKGALDAKRGKIFSKISKEIITAVRLSGADITSNPRLRVAIQEGKSYNMPNDNIDRAIKKGSGELQSNDILEELTYEGFAPHGIAIIVHCLSNNRNRTASELRSTFSKGNGNLGSLGSVAWMFEKHSLFTIEKTKSFDELFNIALEIGAEDVKEYDLEFEIIASVEKFAEILEYFEKSSLNILSAKQQVLIAKEGISLPEKKHYLQVIKLLDALSDLEDAQEVFSNLNFDDKILANFE